MTIDDGWIRIDLLVETIPLRILISLVDGELTNMLLQLRQVDSMVCWRVDGKGPTAWERVLDAPEDKNGLGVSGN